MSAFCPGDRVERGELRNNMKKRRKGFLRCKIRLANWHLSILKWSSMLFGLAIGCAFADVFCAYWIEIMVASVVLGIVFTIIWCKAMKKACKEYKKACEAKDSEEEGHEHETGEQDDLFD